MSLTIYSFITAVLCFNLFVFVFRLLRVRLDIYSGFNFYPIAFVIFLTIARLLMPVELPLTQEINVSIILPAVQLFLQSGILGGSFPVSYFAFIVSIAVSVSVFLFIKYIGNLLTDSKYLHNLQHTDNDRLVTLLSEVIKETKAIKPHVGIVVLSGIGNPMLCGLTNPVILLPEKSLGLCDADIKAILRHEWQHYLNKDLWIKTLTTVLCCIMWWNPAVYLLKSNLDKTLELKCDLDVARYMSDEEKLCYMQSLVNLARILYWDESKEKFHIKVYVPLYLSIPFIGASAKKIKGANDDHNIFQMILPFEKRNHRISVACCVFLLTLFVASYGFVIQPIMYADKYDFFDQVYEDDYVVAIPGLEIETAYILLDEDGTRSLYLQGIFMRYIKDDADLEFVLERMGGIPIINFKGETIQR